MERAEYVLRMTDTHHALPANYGGCADVGISLKCTLEHEESQKEKATALLGNGASLFRDLSCLCIYVIFVEGSDNLINLSSL